MNDMAVRADIQPGVYHGIPNEAYHAGPGVSKSGLWTIYSQSPAHYKFAEREDRQEFDFGEAAHLAILQPQEFEQRVVRGPSDRRGNKWKDAQEFAASNGKLLLTEADYDAVLAVRDAVHSNTAVSAIITGGSPEIESSGYWIDPATGALCRCRPDLYRADLGVMVDVKTTTSARPDTFARSVIDYGYHAQEAFYSDGYRMLGRDVQGFVFIAVEKKTPFAFSIFELPPSIVDEGREIMRRSLETYAECSRAQSWPAYGDDVQELKFPRWAYKVTPAPDGEEE